MLWLMERQCVEERLDGELSTWKILNTVNSSIFVISWQELIYKIWLKLLPWFIMKLSVHNNSWLSRNLLNFKKIQTNRFFDSSEISSSNFFFWQGNKSPPLPSINSFLFILPNYTYYYISLFINLHALYNILAICSILCVKSTELKNYGHCKVTVDMGTALNSRQNWPRETIFLICFTCDSSSSLFISSVLLER